MYKWTVNPTETKENRVERKSEKLRRWLKMKQKHEWIFGGLEEWKTLKQPAENAC